MQILINEIVDTPRDKRTLEMGWLATILAKNI